jgi:hypothetical protein
MPIRPVDSTGIVFKDSTALVRLSMMIGKNEYEEEILRL